MTYDLTSDQNFDYCPRGGIPQEGVQGGTPHGVAGGTANNYRKSLLREGGRTAKIIFENLQFSIFDLKDF